MKKQLLFLALATIFGFGVACATRSASPRATAQQQPPPGYQAPQQGAPPPSSGGAVAAGHQFSECFAATMWHVTGRGLNGGEMPRDMTRIPAGWTPIGGGPLIGGYPSVILCR